MEVIPVPSCSFSFFFPEVKRELEFDLLMFNASRHFKRSVKLSFMKWKQIMRNRRSLYTIVQTTSQTPLHLWLPERFEKLQFMKSKQSIGKQISLYNSVQTQWVEK